jgi:hypothetical protein
MDILATLGVRPDGGCHYPLEGWSVFAERVQPLIERDFYGGKSEQAITPANLTNAYYSHTTIDRQAQKPAPFPPPFDKQSP